MPTRPGLKVLILFLFVFLLLFAPCKMAVHEEDGEGAVEYQLRYKPNNNLQPWLRDKIISEACLHSGSVPRPCPLSEGNTHYVSVSASQVLWSPLLQGQDRLILFGRSADFNPILQTICMDKKSIILWQNGCVYSRSILSNTINRHAVIRYLKSFVEMTILNVWLCFLCSVILYAL